MKNYAKCIEDSNKTLELEPDYVKAYHRRGKAYLACNKFELAIPDFQYILEKNPDDQDINASLMQAREKLRAKEEKAEAAKPKTEEITDDSPPASAPKPAEAKKSGAFKRVQIEEDDDDDEGEIASAPVDSKPAPSTASSSSGSGKGMKIEEISSTETEQSNWW